MYDALIDSNFWVDGPPHSTDSFSLFMNAHFYDISFIFCSNIIAATFYERLICYEVNVLHAQTNKQRRKQDDEYEK